MIRFVTSAHRLSELVGVSPQRIRELTLERPAVLGRIHRGGVSTTATYDLRAWVRFLLRLRVRTVAERIVEITSGLSTEELRRRATAVALEERELEVQLRLRSLASLDEVEARLVRMLQEQGMASDAAWRLAKDLRVELTAASPVSFVGIAEPVSATPARAS